MNIAPQKRPETAMDRAQKRTTAFTESLREGGAFAGNTLERLREELERRAQEGRQGIRDGVYDYISILPMFYWYWEVVEKGRNGIEDLSSRIFWDLHRFAAAIRGVAIHGHAPEDNEVIALIAREMGKVSLNLPRRVGKGDR